MKTKLFILIWLQVSVVMVQAQGFVNLNFESATFTAGRLGGTVSATNAIPGWIPYYDGFADTYIVSNGYSLGGPVINIYGTNNPVSYPPVQGKYFMFLQGGSVGGAHSAAIGQTGLIPFSAQSLIFLGSIGGMQITFNNQALSFAVIGTTGSYTIYGADISSYAGQTGEILFRTPAQTGGILDNIQFSTVAVPEPGVWSLLGLSALLVGGWRWKNRGAA